MKKARGEKSNNVTSVLNTPVGPYLGDDVLEGFTADAEFLGMSNEGLNNFDRNFYNLCKLDNSYIFDFTAAEDQVKIPPMDISQLDQILFTKMKPGKACDIYHLTVEHLRHCGLEAKLCILELINRIFQDIFFLTCPQIKLGLGTAVFKGKNKPSSKSNSYRRITVSQYRAPSSTTTSIQKQSLYSVLIRALISLALPQASPTYLQQSRGENVSAGPLTRNDLLWCIPRWGGSLG